MSGFQTRLVMEVADNQDDGKWILTQPLVYLSDVARQTFTVPAGFQTDLASVPRLPVVYWLTGGTSSEAAVVHDYLYSTHLVDRRCGPARGIGSDGRAGLAALADVGRGARRRHEQ